MRYSLLCLRLSKKKMARRAFFPYAFFSGANHYFWHVNFPVSESSLSLFRFTYGYWVYRIWIPSAYYSPLVLVRAGKSDDGPRKG